jgi:hypothetical protein
MPGTGSSKQGIKRRTRVELAGLAWSLSSGRGGRGKSGPAQLGQTFFRDRLQSSQNVHSNEQMWAPAWVGSRSRSQHSQFGRISRAKRGVVDENPRAALPMAALAGQATTVETRRNIFCGDGKSESEGLTSNGRKNGTGWKEGNTSVQEPTSFVAAAQTERKSSLVLSRGRSVRSSGQRKAKLTKITCWSNNYQRGQEGGYHRTGRIRL